MRFFSLLNQCLLKSKFHCISNGFFYRLDQLARWHLHRVGLNYRHGTGHGIGAYGLIHESPIQVGWEDNTAAKKEIAQFIFPLTEHESFKYYVLFKRFVFFLFSTSKLFRHILNTSIASTPNFLDGHPILSNTTYTVWLEKFVEGCVDFLKYFPPLIPQRRFEFTRTRSIRSRSDSSSQTSRGTTR